MTKNTSYGQGTIFGPFRVVRLISDTGGMGFVYEAVVADGQHPAVKGKRVALKVARGDYHPEIYEKLLRTETLMLQQLRHPGIVRICPFSHGGRIYKTAWYGRGKEPPHDFYFAMEFLEGDSLAQLIRSRVLRSFPLAWRVELLYQIALAIDYLHMRGVAHRDLKPENIMFRAKPQPEQVPQPVLIDFGLSEKRQLTRERDGGVNAATVAYASPEWITALRARHHQATVEIKQNPKEGLLAYDMWSFGMIAYEVLNERYTFGSPDTERTVLENRIVNDQPDPMSNSVPTELASIVMKMLEQRDMNKRLTIEQFVQLLETSSGVVSPRF